MSGTSTASATQSFPHGSPCSLMPLQKDPKHDCSIQKRCSAPQALSISSPAFELTALIMAVGRVAANGNSATKTPHGWLEATISSVGSMQSQYLARTTAGRPSEITASGSCQTSIGRLNLAAYPGIALRLIIEKSHKMVRKPYHAISLDKSRSPPAPALPSQQEGTEGTQPDLEKCWRRAPRGQRHAVQQAFTKPSTAISVSFTKSNSTADSPSESQITI